MRITAALVLLAAAGAASAQTITNGNFETGSLSPWVVTPTAGGVSLFNDVSSYDIDGPAPYPASNTARFMVGKTSPAVQGWQGVELTQEASLTVGTQYRFWVRWSVKPVVNVYSQSGGQFDLIVNGQVLDTDVAPATTGLAPSYGWLTGTFAPAASGPHQIGVRITRPVVAGEEVFQHLDNFTVSTNPCYPDCNGDGRLTVNDTACFQHRWVLQDPWADCNASGTFTVADFGCWRAAFASGCP